MSDNKDLIGQIVKEIQAYPLNENVMGGKDYFSNYVASVIAGNYSLVKDEEGNIKLHDKENPVLEAYKNYRKVTLQSELESLLKGHYDEHEKQRMDLQKKLFALDSSQKKEFEEIQKQQKEAEKNYNPYHHSMKYRTQKEAAKRNAELYLKATGKS